MSEDLFDRSILQTRVRKRKSIDPDEEGFWPNTQDLIRKGAITPLISNYISTEFIFNGSFNESVVKKWSESVNYPWGTRPYITNVAQYARIKSSPVVARGNYLALLKDALYEKAFQDNKNVTTRQLMIANENKENSEYSFTQMARDLGYLDFQSERLSCHPLTLLARLPFKVYITTSHHQFLEVALEQLGKEPDSQVFPWQKRSYVDEIKTPTEHYPLVFHLFGRDDQPESLVLTENDHLDLLAKFIRDSMITNRGDKTDNAGRRIEQGLPRIVRDALFRTNRLLLGYGIRSWDFRVLFRGLLTQQDSAGDSDTGLFIQFMDLPSGSQQDPSANNRQDRERTIAEIFNAYLLNRSKLRVKWATPEKTMQQLYEIWEHGGLREASSAGGTLMDNNPYVGPRPFGANERDKFKGRDEEAEELLTLVLYNRLVLCYAPSGAGKSSLIATRLVPELRERNYVVLPTGRVSGKEIPPDFQGNVFLYNLVDSINGQTAGETPEYKSGMTLASYLRAYNQVDDQILNSDEYELLPQVLIIDQFEELFTKHARYWTQRETFFKLISEAMEKDPSLWVVVAMRDDYLASLEPYTYLVPGGFQTRFYLQPLKRNAALRAIKEPLPEDVRYAEGVAEQLADELTRISLPDTSENGERPLGQFVEPLQLQVVYYSLWEDLPPGTHVIGAQHVGADVDQALATYYARNVKEVADNSHVSEKRIRRWFGETLIRDCKIRELVTRGEKESGGLDNRAIEMLVETRLIREESRSGAIRYELAHDRLIEPICRDNERKRTAQLTKDLQRLGIWAALIILGLLAFLWWSTVPRTVKPGTPEKWYKLPFLANHWRISGQDEEFVVIRVTPTWFGVGKETYVRHEFVPRLAGNAASAPQPEVAVKMDDRWISEVGPAGDGAQQNNLMMPRLYLWKDDRGVIENRIEFPEGGSAFGRYEIEVEAIDQEDQDLMTPEVCLGLIRLHEDEEATARVCDGTVETMAHAQLNSEQMIDLYEICQELRGNSGTSAIAERSCEVFIDNAEELPGDEVERYIRVENGAKIFRKLEAPVVILPGSLAEYQNSEQRVKITLRQLWRDSSEVSERPQIQLLAADGSVLKESPTVEKSSRTVSLDYDRISPGAETYMIVGDVPDGTYDLEVEWQRRREIENISGCQLLLADPDVDEPAVRSACEQAVEAVHTLSDPAIGFELWRSFCSKDGNPYGDLAERLGIYASDGTKPLLLDEAMESGLKAGQNELWSFEADADQIISISMRAGRENVDPLLRLRQTNCNELAIDDDSGERYDALLLYSVPEAGTYIIEAAEYGDGSEPSSAVSEYTLLLTALGENQVPWTSFNAAELEALCRKSREHSYDDAATRVCPAVLDRLLEEDNLNSVLDFCLELTDFRPLAESCDTAWHEAGQRLAQLSVGVPQQETLPGGGGQWWRFTHPGDKEVRLRMDSVGERPVPDPYLGVYPAGDRGAGAFTDDDSGGNLNALVTIPRAGKPAPYFVRAGDRFDDGGRYELSLAVEDELDFSASSANGAPIDIYRYGEGAQDVVVVGGIHAGKNPSSVKMVANLADYFGLNQEIIPEHVTLHFLPNLNPDSLYSYALGENGGRLNGHGVDLNRNWECNWNDTTEDSDASFAGERPFSEPETQGLRDYLAMIDPQLVIFYTFEGGEVRGGICGGRDAGSRQWGEIYADSSGFENVTPQQVSGDVTDWLASQGIPGFFVYPEDRVVLSEDDFANNLNALLAVLNEVPE